MKAQASAKSQKPAPKERATASVSREIAPLSADGNSLQQESCACGGGCPRCSGKRAPSVRLDVSQPGDAHEREADRIAGRVVSGLPVSTPAGAGNRAGDGALGRLGELTIGPGRMLEPVARARMESRFGGSLEHVRVHTDTSAANSAHALGAKAFAVGRHIAFGAGRYAPATPTGERLLAHELAHVLTPSSVPMIQRDHDSDLEADPEAEVEEETPPPPRIDVDELDYAFIFPNDAYGRSAEAFIRRNYPTHRLIRAGSFEEMFDRLYLDTRHVASGHRFHLRELVVVTHANQDGGMRIPLTRGDAARGRGFFTIWELDDLQEEFQEGVHQRFRERRHEVVSTVIDDDTSVVVRGCEFGQADEAMDALRSFFGGQPMVWAPTVYQGYETIPIDSELLGTPEAAFDFLVEHNLLPPELMPAPDEDKRAFIARMFGLHGSIPAEFFVVGDEGRRRIGALMAAHRGITHEAEAEKDREHSAVASSGEFWGLSSHGMFGDDAELDRLSMREIAERAHPLMNPYRPQNACMIARLRRAWERKETSDDYWMDFLMSDTRDPLAGLPGETASFFAYMANRFRDNPAANPFNGIPVESLFGDSNIIAIDSGDYPCATPHEDTFETRMMEHEIPSAEAGTFEDPLVIGEPPPDVSSSLPPRRGSGGTSEATREEVLAARARALDFSKSTTGPETPSLSDALQRLSNEDLIQALGLALEIAAGGDRSYLTAVENEMVRRQLMGPTEGIAVFTLTEAEFEAAAGVPASVIPDQTALTGGAGGYFIPDPLWYYRVLQSHDTAGADLVPRPPDSGLPVEPAGSRAEMTFRHTRPGGNARTVGTDRISTGRSLEAFDRLLRERGTGEVVRVDVDAARRLGAEFLEHPEIQLDLDAMEVAIEAELREARAVGRGRTHIERIEGRLRALRAARDYTRAFHEGHGVGRVPSGAVTPVEGASVAEAVAAEARLLRNIRYMRWGGRVMIIVGAGLSITRIAMSEPEERPRVIAQEAGGWALSLAGAWAGAKAGGAIGAALGVESGPGLFLTGAAGALIGGGIGFFVGESIADSIYDLFE